MLNSSCKYLLNSLNCSIIEQYRFNYSIKIFEIIRIRHLMTINRNTLKTV